jgi:hypothetical protein
MRNTFLYRFYMGTPSKSVSANRARDSIRKEREYKWYIVRPTRYETRPKSFGLRFKGYHFIEFDNVLLAIRQRVYHEPNANRGWLKVKDMK